MNPAFVLGIDGLPYTLVHKLVADGVMPNMSRLCHTGSLSQMHTTIPDFSCVAWTSFATGVNPGKHGIYGFQDFHPTTAEAFMPDVTHCKTAPLWHAVGEAGGRSIIINLPGTYPALPLRGKMVSGFVAPEFDKACYPPMFAQTLKTLGYKMDLDGNGGGLGTPAHVRECLWPVFEARKTTIRHVLENEYWDMCVAVITETDRLQHYFMHILDDPNHADYEWVIRFYSELDAFIGEVADRLEGKAGLFMVSDHGFNVVRREIILQDLLIELELMPNVAEPCWSSEEHLKKAKVLSLDPGRFYINRVNSRFKHGFVQADEEEEILTRIEDKLMSLHDPKTGEAMVSRIMRKDQAFWGETIDYAPDLVAATNPGFYFRSFSHRADENNTVYETKWEANHVWNDAIVYTPYRVSNEIPPRIWDVFPSVLAYMGLDIAEELDGCDLARHAQSEETADTVS